MKDKIIKILDIIEQIDRIPSTYSKHIEDTDGLFEVRVQLSNNIFRIFCFFDDGKLVVLLSAFQNKTPKTPKKEIEKALLIKVEYYKEKRKEQIKEQYHGVCGTPERDRIERELDALRIGFKIKTAREKKNMTQAELAARINKKREFISKIENDGENMTLKTLFDVVEHGLGGKLEICVDL